MNLEDAFTPFPQLETVRLCLRQMTQADAADHFALYSQPQVTAGHGSLPYRDIAQSEELISWYEQAIAERRAFRWAITRRDEDRLIGTCGFHHIRPPHFRAEIGYELHPDYWRCGIGSEAVAAMVRFGFEKMGLHRIEAVVDPANQASAALLRKVGFQEEGYLRERFYDNGRFVDDWFFSLLKPEWEIS